MKKYLSVIAIKTLLKLCWAYVKLSRSGKLKHRLHLSTINYYRKEMPPVNWAFISRPIPPLNSRGEGCVVMLTPRGEFWDGKQHFKF